MGENFHVTTMASSLNVTLCYVTGDIGCPCFLLVGQGSTVENEAIRLVIISLRSPATDKAGPSLGHASHSCSLSVC